jgi:hypothetical protein
MNHCILTIHLILSDLPEKMNLPKTMVALEISFMAFCDVNSPEQKYTSTGPLQPFGLI